MRRHLGVLAVAFMAIGCGTGSVDLGYDEPAPTLFDDTEADDSASVTTTVVEPTATRSFDLDQLPAPRSGAPGVVMFDALAAPVVGNAAGEWTVETPCSDTRSGVSPAPVRTLVVLDPAGDAAGDPSMVDRNHRIALAAHAALVDVGIDALVTRGPEDDVAASFRATAAEASGARVVVSIAVVAGDGELGPNPSLEVVHPVADDAGLRLAGLLHASLRPAVDVVSVGWPGGVEPGVRAVLNQRGTDFFAMLRTGSTSARAVVHLPIDPDAMEFFGSADGAAVVGDALADAVARFLVTDDVGDGFVTTGDAVRDAPTASSIEECLDPLAVVDPSAGADS